MVACQPPIMTVGHPATMTPPWAVESPMRAAGFPPIRTVAEPFTIESGGPVQVAMPPRFAAGRPPIKTVGAPGGRRGPPTCGTPPGLTIGQVCISVTRAAGGMITESQSRRPFLAGNGHQFQSHFRPTSHKARMSPSIRTTKRIEMLADIRSRRVIRLSGRTFPMIARYNPRGFRGTALFQRLFETADFA